MAVVDRKEVDSGQIRVDAGHPSFDHCRCALAREGNPFWVVISSSLSAFNEV